MLVVGVVQEDDLLYQLEVVKFDQEKALAFRATTVTIMAAKVAPIFLAFGSFFVSIAYYVNF